MAELGGAIVVKNLKDVLDAIDGAADKIEIGAQIGIGRAALAIERQAKENANNGERSYEKRVSRNGNTWLKVTPDRHIGPSGGGPNVITGNLKRSIHTEIPRGFGDKYVAIVGASAEYARAVELGAPQWKSGVKYPYLEPAAMQMIRNGTVHRLFIGSIKERLKSG